MVQQEIFSPEKLTRYDLLSKKELISEVKSLESELRRLIRENYRLRKQEITETQLDLILKEQLSEIRAEHFGASSERYINPQASELSSPSGCKNSLGSRDGADSKSKPPASTRVKKLSERYPDLEIKEILVQEECVPDCEVCGKKMLDSGMTEDSEQLTVIERKFEIKKIKRAIYRCGCQSCMKTAANPPRIVEGSSYSDEMILDVALSKYCDLNPIERYVQMAERSGLRDLPANSLYDLTHRLADFLLPVYQGIKSEVMGARVLHADETPHKMLEGSDKKSWYLWGYSTPGSCYLEIRDSRSGEVALETLIDSKLEVLVSDVYTGYGKAIGLANEARAIKGRKLIINANCNAHARRYFFKARGGYPEADFYLDQYQIIYRLNAESKGKSPEQIKEIRDQMREYFKKMKAKAESELPNYPVGKYKKALSYFLENYTGLTYFLEDWEIPIDNNAQERLLRSHVVGRKTWYGTHSERGAQTAAVLFSIVESCKLNQINPREYFAEIVKDLLAGAKAYTPLEFKRANTS